MDLKRDLVPGELKDRRVAALPIAAAVGGMATDWGDWNERNPAQRVRLGRKNRKWPKRIPTDEPIRSLPWELEPQTSLMLLTAASKGMRIGEILALKWRSVDLDRGLIFVDDRDLLRQEIRPAA